MTMKYEFTVFELGEALKKIEKKLGLKVLVKQTINGGWITVQGDAEIIEHPKKITHGCPGGINNVISIKLSENNVDGSVIKIIGAKNKKFNASLDSAKRITVKKGGLALNQFKEEKEESALKVDDNIVFSIKASAEEVASIIEG